jgi:hypothetical protein
MTKQLDFHMSILKDDIKTVEKLLNSKFVNPAFDHNYFLGFDSKRWVYRFLGGLFKLNSYEKTLKNNLAILSAADKGKAGIVNLLLNDPRVDPTVKKNFALSNAIQNGHFEVVKLLVNDKRVQDSLEKDTLSNALLSAIHKRKLNVFEHLLTHTEVNPSKNNNHSIILASREGLIGFMELLLNDPRVNPSDDKNAAIHLAYYNKHDDCIALLWSDKRVRNTLLNDFPDIYNELIQKDIKEKLADFL